jgi:hypothetical protein
MDADLQDSPDEVPELAPYASLKMVTSCQRVEEKEIR